MLTNARRQIGNTNPSAAELANFLGNGEATKVSAETNGLSRMDLSDAELVFLHSDTADGGGVINPRYVIREAGKPVSLDSTGS